MFKFGTATGWYLLTGGKLFPRLASSVFMSLCKYVVDKLILLHEFHLRIFAFTFDFFWEGEVGQGISF